MFLTWITLVLAVIGTNADGEFSVLYNPASLSFIRTEYTVECIMKEIYCAALGLSVEQNADWKGMSVIDPFSTPEAVVQVYIDGVSSLGENAGLKSKVFPLTVEEYEPDTFKGVQGRINQRFDTGDNTIVNIKLSDEDTLETINNFFGNMNLTSYKANYSLQLVYLKQSVEEDRHFLNELATLRAVVGKVLTGAVTPDNLIDFYSFRFRSLHALSDFYGPISSPTKEAKKLLGGVLDDLSKAFVKAYDGSVLVTVVSTDVAHTRRSARSLKKPLESSKNWPHQWLEPPISRKKMNTLRNASDTAIFRTVIDPQFKNIAAIFNIILWLSVILVYSMIAIIYACMDMDPGRDTIIYRMTTMRTKKEA